MTTWARGCRALAHPMRILIVEDEKKIAQLLRKGLTAEGFAVDVCLNGDEGFAAAKSTPFDAILLDIMLPGRDGLSILKELRAAQISTPVLLLTARGEVSERIEGLNLGADDYMAKPFSMDELVARLRALLRRKAPAAAIPTTQWDFGTLTIHLIRREVLVDGRAMALTSTEFRLLVELARQPGASVSREQLSNAVQAGAYRPLDRTVDVQVGRLRRRLAAMAPGQDWIETVRGEGYAFVPRGSPHVDAHRDAAQTP